MKYFSKKYSINKVFSAIFAVSVLSLFSILDLSAQSKSTENKLYNPSKEYFETISNKTYFDYLKEYQSHFDTIENKRGTGYKPFKRMEYFWSQRIGKDGKYPDLLKAYNEAQNFLNSNSKINETQNTSIWQFVGVTQVPPFSQGNGFTGIGRINFVEFHPTNSNIIWAAASGGGVWRSSNGGSSWQNFDATDFMSLGIACISVSKSSPNTVYAATGDANGPSGMGAYFSIGIYKTTNNGATWALLPTPTGANLQQSNQFLIYAMDVHPTNANIVYVATNVGVYVSQNGGNSWTQISSGLCRDLVLHATDPNIVYGAFRVSGSSFKISKYTVSSNTWKDVATITNCIRTRLAVHKNFPTVAYAINVNQNNGFRSILKTTDNGESWNQTSPTTGVFNYLGLAITQNSSYGQGSYDLAISMSPRNQNELVIGGIHAWISNNSGQSFTPISNGYYENINVEYVHPDQHHLAFNGNRLFSANDGGIVYSDNFGTNWTNISSGLANTEHSRLSVAANNGNIMLSGSQDNGTFLKSGNNWLFASGGDGMDNGIDPTNPNFMYAASQNGNFVRSTNGGQSFASMINENRTGEQAYWCAPLVIDPVNPSTIYVGFQNVWKSTDRGVNWTKISALPTNANRTLTTIAVAPSNNQVIYTTYSEFSHPTSTNRSYLYRTTNGGGTWEQVYSNPSFSITAIAVHPTSPTRVYVVVSGYGSGQKVYEINGSVATNISGNLPNLPVNAIVYQPGSSDRLYIGNDMGIFTKDRNTANWSPAGTGLPNVIVNDIEIHSGTGKLKIATYGRGVWELDLLNCSLASPELYTIGKTEFCTGDSLILETKNAYAAYEWSNGAKTRRIVVKNNGNYYVTVTDDKGCKASSAEVAVSVGSITPLVLEYDKSKLTLCENDSLVVNAKGFYSKFEWNTGASTRKLVIREAGEYYLTVTSNSSSCQTTSEKIVVTTIPAPEKPTVEFSDRKLTASDATRYQWYLNNQVIAGVTTREFIPEVPGDYRVGVFNQAGCETLSDAITLDDHSLSIEDELTNTIIVKPNPNNGEFTINLNNDIMNKFDNVQIIDVLGNVVYDNKLNNTTGLLQINLSNYAKGNYFIILKNENMTLSKLVIKQ